MKAIETITGRVSVLNRDDVDTDQIIPKQFLKRIERTGFGEFLFYDWAQQPGWELPRNPILVAGRNFGCGSSREHAPWALEDYGCRAVISPRFADIFRNNCLKIGLVPVELPGEVVARIMRAIEDDVIIIASPERIQNGLESIRVYDIRDLIEKYRIEGQPALVAATRPASQPATQQSATADPPSYRLALATGSPVSWHISVWYSKTAWRVPCDASAWYGVYAV